MTMEDWCLHKILNNFLERKDLDGINEIIPVYRIFLPLSRLIEYSSIPATQPSIQLPPYLAK